MPDRVGQQLGNYKILRHLGNGGFAEVYLGEHIYLKTSAAIKVLRTRLSGPKDLDDFLKQDWHTKKVLTVQQAVIKYSAIENGVALSYNTPQLYEICK